MTFEPGVFCKDPDQRGYWFLFKKDTVLYFGKGENIRFPELLSPSELGLKTSPPQFIGVLDGKNAFTAQVYDTEEIYYNCCGVAQYTYASPRELYPQIGPELFTVVGRALHICRWHQSWKFCPSCGAAMEDSKTERAKVCTACGRTDYPILSPAIIVAVSRGDTLLLAHNTRFPGFRHSIIAGFVESGESAEDAIRREVMEEVGIHVKNIRYFGSQCWPYPNSFMLGFTAEYESGEITPDGVEIDTAGWYTAADMPPIPAYGSISRLLIEDFKKKHPVK